MAKEESCASHTLSPEEVDAQPHDPTYNTTTVVKMENGNCKHEGSTDEKTTKEEDAKEAPDELRKETFGDWVILFWMFIFNIVAATDFGGTRVLYPDLRIHFQTTRAAVGWVFAIHDFFSLIMGFLFTYPMRIYGCRCIAVVGGFLFAVGVTVSAFAPTLEFLYLSHGLITGIGGSMSLLAEPVVIQQRFSKNRGMACGITMLGWSCGNTIGALLMNHLRYHFGWKGALLLLGAIQAHKIPLSMFFNAPYEGKNNAISKCDKEDEPKESRLSIISRYIKDTVDFTVMKKTPFLIFCLVAFMQKFIHLGYLTHTFNMSLDMGLSREQAVWAFSVINISAVICRVLVTFVANIQCLPRTLIYATGMFFFAAAMVFLFLLPPLPATMTSSIMSGLFIGSTQTIFSVIIVDILGVDLLSRGIGAFNFVNSFAVLIASPIAGAIFDLLDSYTVPFSLFGGLGFVGGTILVVEQFFQRKAYKSHSVFSYFC